jgi:lipopolysaccharide export system protein LptA
VFSNRVTRRLVWISLAVINWGVAHAQERTQEPVVVSAESEEAEHDQFTEMGEYAQPAWAERSRFSSTTSVYVLSPYEMFAGNIW